MGTDIAYLPALYLNEKIDTQGTPFILQKDGTKKELKAETTNKTKLILHSTTKRKLVKSTDGSEKAFFENGKEYELFY